MRYAALAADLYGGQVASAPGQAQKLTQASMQNRAALEENRTPRPSSPGT